MTSSPEKPICCPCCRSYNTQERRAITGTPTTLFRCLNCMCTWDESRRAQPAIGSYSADYRIGQPTPPMDEREAFETAAGKQFIMWNSQEQHDTAWWAWKARAKVGKP